MCNISDDSKGNDELACTDESETKEGRTTHYFRVIQVPAGERIRGCILR